MISVITIRSKAVFLIVFCMSRYSFVGMYLFDMFTIDCLIDSCITAAGAAIVRDGFFLASHDCHAWAECAGEESVYVLAVKKKRQLWKIVNEY